MSPPMLLSPRDLAPQPPTWHALRPVCSSWRSPSTSLDPANPRASPLFRLLESLYDTVKGVSGGSLRGPLRLLARSLGRRCRTLPRLRRLEREASPASAVASVPRSSCWHFRASNVGCARLAQPSEVPRWPRFLQTKWSRTLATPSGWIRCSGDMSRLAYETIRELMAAAADDKTLCPGMVTFIQVFGNMVNLHPHLHALVSRGGWTPSGEWIPT